MDEQYIIDLYNQLGGESKFGKFEDFKSLITTDPSYQKDFHSAFGENTLGSFNDFSSLVSIQQQPAAPKKKEGFGGVLSQPLEAVQEADQLAQQESVSPSDQSSSVSPSTDQSKRIATQYSWAGGTQQVPTAEIQSTESPAVTETLGFESQADIRKRQAQAKIDAEKRKVYEEERLKKEAAENLLNWRETQALKIQEEEKKKEEEARLRAESLGISKTPEFVSKLNKIDNTLFYDEEKIKNLNDEFKDYGIVINKGGIFNNKLIARTEDGRASIEIDLTPDSEAQMVEESNKLRKFLNENNRISQDEDFLSKALRAKKMRPSPLVPGSDFVAVGNKVIPTTFPKEIAPGMGTLPFGEQFIKLPIDEALKVAKERGELFTFKTKEEAQDFADGSWKNVSQVDIEGDVFYKQRGRDYITEKRRWERYDELDDLINFFEGYDTKNEEEIKAENPNLFVNGKPRYDIKEIVAGFKKEREQLRPLVKDITFLNQEGTSEKMRMDFDSYLAKRENEIAAEATKTFREAQSDLSIINTESLKLFGVNINELTKNDKYKTQNPQAYNNLIQKYTDITQLAQTAGIKYADAKTYYDAKINKEINSDLTDNVEATVNALSDGFKNGLIGDQLLAMTIPGYDAWSGFKDKESAAKYISEKLSQMSQTQSRVMTRYGQSKTARDWWDVFLDDPFESMVLMAGQSISQALPYGVKIVPLITGYSSLTGAAYGGATTGGAGVLPGFVGGGLFGLRTGQAVTGYATEYTNAIMEAVKNNGYDPLNPKSLEQALNDQKVWDEGAKVGAARGIPIAVVDYLTAGLAGKMIKPASKLATTTSKMTRAAAENILVDPTAEAAGELIAQGTEIALGTGREALDWSEIGMEGIGGMGSNIPNYVLNTYLATKANTDINLAYNLTDVKKLAAENVSDERISRWANNMEKLGKIDASVNQRIQENIGLRRDAKEVLSVGGGSASSNVVARTMELLDAKKQLTATKNRQEVYSAEIKSINEELATIGKTKKLAPVEQQTNLKGIIEAIPEAQREAVGEYMINNIRYTKEQFLDKINSFTPARLLKSKIAVKGDPEVSQTFQEKVNAIQKQTTGEVPVQPEARVGEEVEIGVAEPEPQVTPEEGVTIQEEGVEEKVIPIKERTPEQEADFLEELLSGKKPVTAPVVEEEVKVEIPKAEEVKVTPAVTTEGIGSEQYKTNTASHLPGRQRERTIPDGTKIKGTYKVVSADEVFASHNEETFAKTEGFPVNEQGKTVNDRDYETDKAAQSEVVRIAESLDERAISQTPIVTKDGIVVDGNNRTMSRKLAAKRGTDRAYLEALKQDAEMYGIDPEQIDNIKNPMLVFEADQQIPYTTKEFARFNKAEKKEKSPIEKAVELSKTITDRARRVLSGIYDLAEKPSDVTSNSKNMSEVKKLLLDEGILQPNELPRYINPETGTATKEGVAFLETLLIGSALNENAIRMLDNEGMGTAKMRVIESVIQITQNAALKENSLQSNIENGIKLLNKATQANISVVDVISQMDLFEMSEFSAEDLAIAVLLDGKGFKGFLQKYNSEVGTESFFGKMTKEGLIDELLNDKIKGYEQIRKNLRPDVEIRQAEVQEGDGGIKSKTEGEKLAEAIRKNLKIKGPQGLQSNFLGVPIAIWNAGVETIAAAARTGVDVAIAVNNVIEQLKTWHKESKSKRKFDENALKNALSIEYYKEVVKMARENNVNDAGIKVFLTRKGLQESQINEIIDGKVKVEPAKKEAPKKEAPKKETAKKVVTAESIISEIKDIKNITDDEKDSLVKQIKGLVKKTTKDVKALWLKTSASMAKDIRAMSRSGKITSAQAANVISRMSKVNMLNEDSVERFVDYMAKVFNDANYAEKITRARKMIRTAKANIKSKIGVSETLSSSMSQMFNIDPSLIPMSVFDTYLDLIEMMGKRQAVLTLKDVAEVTKDVDKVMNAVIEEQSVLDALIDLFNEFEEKVLDENGKIDFSATLDAMLDKKLITTDDVKLYKKYKNKVLTKVSKEKKSAEQLAEEKEILIDDITNTDINTNKLELREERDFARKLKDLINPKALKDLTNQELNNLLKTIDNINNGFLPHYAVIMTQKLTKIQSKKELEPAIKNAGRLPITKLIANIKSLFPGAKTADMIMVIESPKFVMDQVFGNFKERPIYNSIFKRLTESYANYKTDSKIVKEKLEKAAAKVAKSYYKNPRKVKMSTFKMMTYALQLEYNSNKDKGEGFYSAADYIKETIKHTRGDKSVMSNYDIKLMQKILDLYGIKDSNGNVVDIDINKLYKSFNDAEKQAIKTIQEVNASVKDKAMFTAAVIRSDKTKPIDNYVHHNVLPTGIAAKDIKSVSGDMNQRMMPSTRAKSLIERTKGAKPISFDIYNATFRSANQVLMDYHLTEPVRTSRMILNETKNDLQENGTEKELNIFNAIDSAFETTLNNTLVNTFVSDSTADKVSKMLTRQAYRVILSSAKRWLAELSSNLTMIITDPKAYINGVTKYKKYVMSEKGPAIMRNISSGVQDRVYEDSLLSGRMIDSSIMDEAIGLSGTTSNYLVSNAMQTIFNNSVKPYTNFVATTADALISTPDKIMMRPFWFGIFASEFKKATGQEIDFDKIANNDEAYLSQFKDSINFAKDKADEMIMLTGSTKNPFAARQKAMTVKDATVLANAYRTFNNFMNNFIISEYVAARTAIYAMMGNGRISQRQGAALLTGVILRTTLYSFLIKELGRGLLWLFTGDDGEEDEEKTLLEKVGQSFAGSMTALLLGRDFGNVARTMINYGVEKVNENYVQDLIDGKYTDSDVIAYNIIPNSLNERPQFVDLMINLTGPGQPYLRTAKNLYENTFGPEPTKEETIKKRELYWNRTLPLEIMGNAGLVPLYKDVRQVTNQVLRNEVAKIKGDDKEKGEEEITKSQAYDNHKTLLEFRLADPQKFEEYSKEGGLLHKYKQQQSAETKESKSESREKLIEQYGKEAVIKAEQSMEKSSGGIGGGVGSGVGGGLGEGVK